MEIGNDLQFNIGAFCFHLRAPNEKLRSLLRKTWQTSISKETSDAKDVFALSTCKKKRRKEF